MADFITLSCNACGGKLKITQEINNFACAYCGTEYAVNRGDGVISLNPLTDEIIKVKEGVDKTASELAIARLKDEISNLSDDQKNVDNELSSWTEKRGVEREELVNKLKGKRNTRILFLVIGSVVLSSICFIFILNLGPEICGIMALVIIAIFLILGFSKNIRDFTGKLELQKFDDTSAETSKALTQKSDNFQVSIIGKEEDLLKHERIVGIA